ncbi:MAG: hypothetical protein Q9216_004154 [Gyalolechia sp. 2 TL-2023]
MAFFLCSRASAPSISFVKHFKEPASPLIRCLHHATRSTSHNHPALRSQTFPPQTAIPARRTFTSSPPRFYKTVEEARSRNHSGPFSVRSAVLFLTVGAFMIVYFRFEKGRIERNKIAEATKGVGKPKVGGKFELMDQSGRQWTDENLKGGFSLIYFGFTHCPDICPDELDKMGRMIDIVNGPRTASTSPVPPPPPPSSTIPSFPTTPSDTTTSTSSPSTPQPSRPPLVPIFITCDPARDTPSVLSPYLKEFHPSLVGLTGTWQQVKDTCKAYRVYFSTPEGVKAGQDYLVDHSIYFYLMDPDGDFVECLGRQHTPESAAKIIKNHMSDWRNGIKVQ